MRCRVGDLAFITRAHFPQNIGRIVRVVGPATLRNHDWVVESVDGPMLATNLLGQRAERVRAETSDNNLCPIRPEPEQLPAPPATIPESIPC